ncbi:ABC transporter ATP-binding protein [Desulfotruncus alcoholivorax]|uniref:ABC transporter ATP-binding protein n=1 Tax=Desulfotruncus alcoholivorax TaxID=265477 RepID=UPI0003FBBDCE|nr:dipeptide ABC transporter ATP-binding protein [Desulfotruncus alcoholivorax]
MSGALLEVKDVKKHFPIKRGLMSKNAGCIKAVDGVSFSVHKGETLGLVGESGCGKSTTGRLVLRLLEPTSGEVLFEDKNIYRLSFNQMRQLRRDMQIIFQDPYASLNPRLTVEDIIIEPLVIHGIGDSHSRRQRVKEMLDLVGLSSYHGSRYPHEFSGGQRQRIGIARALALNPKLIVCDEPVSALDVSIQSQVLNLLMQLQDMLKLTYIFIAHGLNVVKHVSDRVGVMYLGKIVEIADSEELYRNAMHPYSQALLSAVPVPDPEIKRERIILTGDVPSPANPPTGCRFHTRCPQCMDICRLEEPALRPVSDKYMVACHKYQ